MVNNSTNINKMNNHFNSLNIEKTMTYEVGNPVPGFIQSQRCSRVIRGLQDLALYSHKDVAGLYGVNGIPIPLLIIEFPPAIHI